MHHKVTIIYHPNKGGKDKIVIVEIILGDGMNQIGRSIREQLHNIINSIDFGPEVVDVRLNIGAIQVKLDEIYENAERFKLVVTELKNPLHFDWEVICTYYLDTVKKMGHKEIAEIMNFPDARAIRTILGRRLEVFDAHDIKGYHREFIKLYGHLNDEIVASLIAVIYVKVKKKGTTYFPVKKRGMADE